jgi:hypothetical protein
MANAEIINEVNGLLKMALGLLETIENKLPAEEAHVEEAHAEEAHAEEAHAEEAHAEEAHVEEAIEDEQDVPAAAAQANVAEVTVHAAEADATVVVDQT